ncbi:MAG: glycosyltransferase family 4 protein, partial [Blastocatellia bacterium]
MAVEPNQTTASLDPSLSNSELRSPLASPIASDSLPRKPVVVLLNLSGGEESARAWVERQFAGFRHEQLPKSLLKWGSKREQLKRIRAIRPDEFAVFTADIDFQSGREAILAFGAATGARRVTLGDAKGRILRRSRWRALFLSPLRLILELIIAYITVVPLAWLFTVSIGVYCRMRPLTPIKRGENARDAGSGLSVLYIRGSLATGGGANAAGGMATHVTGFTRAAISLGHRIAFISSGTAGLPTDVLKDSARDHPPDLRNDIPAVTILPPSGAFSATRAMFEVSNSLLFTRRTFKTLRHKRFFDLIYQRYNRFNYTGVALSALRRIPLILEYNGSEVWVGKNWDPVGLVWLLKRFERINHRFANLIVVVSEAEKRNLMAAGVAKDR